MHSILEETLTHGSNGGGQEHLNTDLVEVICAFWKPTLPIQAASLESQCVLIITQWHCLLNLKGNPA